jgi:epoxyqueuosine reductase QueG
MYVDLLSLAASLRVFHLGIADLDALTGLQTQPPDLLSRYRRGISLAIRLDDGIVDGLLPENNPRPGEPTPAYAQLYAQTNQRLDQVALQIVRFLQGRGYRAEAIPASETLLGHRGALPHKAVARQAGLGWIGRHLQLIVPGAGPRLRLSTVLTDALLPTGKPISGDCGSCRACITICPAKALLYVDYEDYPPRHEALDVTACSDYLHGFARRPEIGRRVCGMCMAVCPAERK